MNWYKFYWLLFVADWFLSVICYVIGLLGCVIKIHAFFQLSLQGHKSIISVPLVVECTSNAIHSTDIFAMSVVYLRSNFSVLIARRSLTDLSVFVHTLSVDTHYSFNSQCFIPMNIHSKVLGFTLINLILEALLNFFSCFCQFNSHY